MSRHGSTKLVPPKAKPEDQALEVIEDTGVQKQKEELVFTELDNQIECPRCHEFMELTI